MPDRSEVWDRPAGSALSDTDLDIQGTSYRRTARINKIKVSENGAGVR